MGFGNVMATMMTVRPVMEAAGFVLCEAVVVGDDQQSLHPQDLHVECVAQQLVGITALVAVMFEEIPLQRRVEVVGFRVTCEDRLNGEVRVCRDDGVDEMDCSFDGC